MSQAAPHWFPDGGGYPIGFLEWAFLSTRHIVAITRRTCITRGAYPKPGQLLREAARVLRPGGQVGILHFIVPLVRRPLKLLGVWRITTGAGYAIRAWSLFRKEAT